MCFGSNNKECTSRKICSILGKKKRMLDDRKNRKLRICTLLKQNFGIASYLKDINDTSVRKSICSFRISADRLRIERNRYVGEKLDERSWNTCNTIEDEIHF